MKVMWEGHVGRSYGKVMCRSWEGYVKVMGKSYGKVM